MVAKGQVRRIASGKGSFPCRDLRDRKVRHGKKSRDRRRKKTGWKGLR